MALHCAVKDCHNGDYRLKVWKGQHCDVHNCNKGTSVCICDPPFRLFPFPTVRKNKERREIWKEAINRADRTKPWLRMEPSKDQRVCSKHFMGGEPSLQHPDPVLDMGYTIPTKRRRKSPADRSFSTVTTSSLELAGEVESTSTLNDDTDVPSDHPSIQSDLIEMTAQLEAMKLQLTELKETVAQGKRERLMLEKRNRDLMAFSKKPLHEKLLQSNDDCQFYTGIQSIKMFTALHKFTAPFVRRRWRGGAVVSTKAKRNFTAVSPKKFGPSRKLSSLDEFLMVLMKLRLGLLNKDLATRFQISVTLVSSIFSSWIIALDQTIGELLVFWPNKDQLLATKPARYRHLRNLVSIIDCSELFIETPKNMDLQFITWSDYKHHNTLKFLISVAPNSAITYVSPLYCGRVSDTALTNDCGYLDLLDPYDEIMADKGFMIQKECDSRSVSLKIPPGKRGAAQMSVIDLQKTKQVANLRILVEQVIRRVKTFRIVKQELPISLIGLAEKIVRVIAALVNLYLPIYKN